MCKGGEMNREEMYKALEVLSDYGVLFIDKDAVGKTDLHACLVSNDYMVDTVMENK